MSYFEDDYELDDDGFVDDDDFNEAIENGDLIEFSSGGGYWNRETGQEFWPDGTRK